eukprot:378302-Rhodomonas_salina.4
MVVSSCVISYVISGAEIEYAACYAMPGTDIAYAATRGVSESTILCLGYWPLAAYGCAMQCAVLSSHTVFDGNEAAYGGRVRYAVVSSTAVAYGGRVRYAVASSTESA